MNASPTQYLPRSFGGRLCTPERAGTRAERRERSPSPAPVLRLNFIPAERGKQSRLRRPHDKDKRGQWGSHTVVRVLTMSTPLDKNPTTTRKCHITGLEFVPLKEQHRQTGCYQPGRSEFGAASGLDLNPLATKPADAMKSVLLGSQAAELADTENDPGVISVASKEARSSSCPPKAGPKARSCLTLLPTTRFATPPPATAGSSPLSVPRQHVCIF
jgi:hypothetical protein